MTNMALPGVCFPKWKGPPPLDVFRQFEWYQVICMNGSEGFLPKKQNFTMQAVQVLWFRPISDIQVLTT